MLYNDAQPIFAFLQFNSQSETGPAFSSPAFSTCAFLVLFFHPCILGPTSSPAFSGRAFFYVGNLFPRFPVVSIAL